MMALHTHKLIAKGSNRDMKQYTTGKLHHPKKCATLNTYVRNHHDRLQQHHDRLQQHCCA
jgi:hypothetical protein